MNISFSKRNTLPTSLHAGRVYFTNEGVFIADSSQKIISYSHKKLQEFTEDSIQLIPNIYYKKTNQSSTLTITLAENTNALILNEYIIEFTTATSGTTISLPNTIKWLNGETPTFDSNTTYQISIVNNLGIVAKFK